MIGYWADWLINLSQPRHFLLSTRKIVLPLLFWILEIKFGLIFFPPLTNDAYAEVRFKRVVSAAKKNKKLP